jgi:hypothetical protein
MSDPFRYHDGAYVLGALDDLDRRAFEAHLQTCAECRARVADARPAVGLLAGLTLSEVGEPAPMPDTLLPGLLRAARRERVRHRGLLSGITAVAAACAAALVVVLWPGGGSAPAPTPAAQAFVQLQPSPVSAKARLVSRAWGTEIDLHCHYAKGVDQYLPYRLVVVDKQNARVDAGSWTLAPGGEVDFVGGTSVQRRDIARVEITRTDGTPILVLRA